MKFKRISPSEAKEVRKDIQLWYMDKSDNYPVCDSYSPEDWRRVGDTFNVYMCVHALESLGRQWYIRLDDDKPEYESP